MSQVIITTFFNLHHFLPNFLQLLLPLLQAGVFERMVVPPFALVGLEQDKELASLGVEHS